MTIMADPAEVNSKHPLQHIAIIMDGNGRWGLKKFKNRLLGHKQGIENIKPIVNLCIKKNIKALTLYALSYDNFKNRNNK